MIDDQSTCRTVDMGVERVVCYSSTLPVSTGVPGRMRRASILSVLDGRPGGPGQFTLVLQTTRTFPMSYFTRKVQRGWEGSAAMSPTFLTSEPHYLQN